MVKLCLNFRPDGRRYEGTWRRGKQSGTGYYRNKENVIVFGEWENGKIVTGTAKVVNNFNEVPRDE